MAILSLSGVVTWWAIVGPHMVLSFGTGMIVPNASRRRRHVSQARRHGVVAGRPGADGHGRAGHHHRGDLTVIGSRYIAMPLVIGLMPFALATVLSARLLRPRPRAPKLEP